MLSGCLENLLYSPNKFLDLPQRLNILLDVALALEYLHHGYSTSVVHHVSDFGISKLLAERALISL